MFFVLASITAKIPGPRPWNWGVIMLPFMPHFMLTFTLRPNWFMRRMSDEEPSERTYAKRDRKKRGVNLSALEKLKAARSGATKAVDNIEVHIYSYIVCMYVSERR